jgi:hypothetical protein
MKIKSKSNKTIYIFTFIAALSQLFSPLILRFDSFGTINPLIIPADYTFAIWGVITLGCALFGGYQLFFLNYPIQNSILSMYKVSYFLFVL